MTPFLTEAELAELGLGRCGRDVRISRFARIHSPETLFLGDCVRIDDFCVVTGRVEIGSFVHVAAHAALYGRAGITLGDYSGISGRVSLYSASDDYLGLGMTNPTVPERFRRVHQGPVEIGRHAILGCGTVVLPDVSVGEGAAVGALSLVREDCDPWTLYTGNPAAARGRRRQDRIRAFEAEHRRELGLDGP